MANEHSASAWASRRALIIGASRAGHRARADEPSGAGGIGHGAARAGHQVGERLARERAAAALARRPTGGGIGASSARSSRRSRYRFWICRRRSLSRGASGSSSRGRLGIAPESDPSQQCRRADDGEGQGAGARARGGPGSRQTCQQKARSVRGIAAAIGALAGAAERARLEAEEPSPRTGADPGAMRLNQSIDRYARAWMDAWRMRENDLPVLEHQKTELRHAGEALEKHAPRRDGRPLQCASV